MTLHLAQVIGVTVALAGGLFGLGDLLTRRDGGGIRWVYGWSALWWIVALPAEFLGPRFGAACGAAAVVVGLIRLLRRSRELQRPALTGVAALLLGAPLWLAPVHFYDALVYHIGLPWSWLVNSSFAPTAHNLFSHFPLAGSTVFLLPVSAGVPEAAAGLHWLTFAIVLATVVRLAKNLGAGSFAWMAAVLLGGTWHAPWMASLAGSDHLVLLGFVVATELWTAPEESGRHPWVATGVALGLALSSKYTAVVPVAGLLVAAFVLCRPRRYAIGSGAVALATSSFWWVRNAATMGNPIHPLLWNWFGGGGWSADDYARYTSIVREGVTGARGLIVGPVALAAPAQLGVWFAVAAVVALVAVFARRPESRPARVVAATALLSSLGWAATAQTPRYALAVAALVAALAAAGLAQLSPRVARLAAATLGVAAIHGVVVLGVFLFVTLGVQRTWLGGESREAWRRAVTLNDPAPAYRAAESLLPRDARILIVGEGRPYSCPRPHDVSSPYDSQQLQAIVERSARAADVLRAVTEAGWTHLMFNWAELNRLGGDDYRVLRWRTPADSERFQEFATRFAERLWTEGALEIRAVRSGAPASAIEPSSR